MNVAKSSPNAIELPGSILWRSFQAATFEPTREGESRLPGRRLRPAQGREGSTTEQFTGRPASDSSHRRVSSTPAGCRRNRAAS